MVSQTGPGSINILCSIVCLRTGYSSTILRIPQSTRHALKEQVKDFTFIKARTFGALGSESLLHIYTCLYGYSNPYKGHLGTSCFKSCIIDNCDSQRHNASFSNTKFVQPLRFVSLYSFHSCLYSGFVFMM